MFWSEKLREAARVLVARAKQEMPFILQLLGAVKELAEIFKTLHS